MTALFMISLPIDLRDFRRWSAERGIAGDEGKAFHHLLCETFGKSVLQPFRMMAAPGGRTATLYAYTKSDETTLRETAGDTAMPDALAVIDPRRLAAKSMPESWRQGRRLAFDIRVRPIRRLHKPLEDKSREGREPPPPFRKGAEIDAFLVEALRRFPDGPPPPEERRWREDVYRGWLAERLDGAANVETARMMRFERTTAVRRGTTQGPDVTFHGELTVTDGVAFAERLAKGVGRHTAYGYGMLLLRPASP